MFSIDLSYKRAFYISFLSILGRYLPGRFWIFTLVLAFSKSLNLDLKNVTKAQMLNQFFLIYSAIPMLLIYFYEIKNNILFFIFTFIFFLSPLIFAFLPEKYKIKLNFKQFFIILLMFLFLWLIVGFSLYFFILAFNKNIPIFYSFLIFPISYNIGVLSLIAPAGIGVREGVMIFMLLKFFDIEFSNKISVLFRIFNLLIEFALSILAYFFFHMDKAQK
ncbi:MAG: lysylphosphatidylglycerol synthase domain-containing protein [candidate division WOR-3 bacterium]